MNQQGSKQKGNVHSQITATVFKVIRTQANITITFGGFKFIYGYRYLTQMRYWLLVKVLHPTQHKIGHFRYALPSQSLD